MVSVLEHDNEHFASMSDVNFLLRRSTFCLLKKFFATWRYLLK
jgi:hypothetical protein